MSSVTSSALARINDTSLRSLVVFYTTHRHGESMTNKTSVVTKRLVGPHLRSITSSLSWFIFNPDVAMASSLVTRHAPPFICKDEGAALIGTTTKKSFLVLVTINGPVVRRR